MKKSKEDVMKKLPELGPQCDPEVQKLIYLVTIVSRDELWPDNIVANAKEILLEEYDYIPMLADLARQFGNELVIFLSRSFIKYRITEIELAREMIKSPSVDESKICYICNEQIKIKANRCRFCGAEFSQGEVETQIKIHQLRKFAEQLDVHSIENLFRKECPSCAEYIEIEIINCPFCKSKFNIEEIWQQIDKLESDLKEKEEIVRKIRVGLTCCPSCGKWDVHKAFTEDGGMGDWCPNCKKSIKKIKRDSRPFL
jgi:hypothetical protein